MKEMTATEVARNFSAVLDSVEAGEEIVILRGKVEIARMTPAAKELPNGAAIIDFMEKREREGLLAENDSDFDSAMAAIIDHRVSNRVPRKNSWQK